MKHTFAKDIAFFHSSNQIVVDYGKFNRKDKDQAPRNRDRFQNRDRDRGGSNREFGGYKERNERFGEREQEESVFSKKVRAGRRRTYFMDVRQTRGNDYFLTITESTRREDGFGYKRHKIFLYKEDFNRFLSTLNEVVEHVKKELMPDFDYEEFDRRQAEWEAQNKDFDDEFDDRDMPRNQPGAFDANAEDRQPPRKDDEDMTW